MSIWFFIIPFAIAAALPGPAQAALVGRVLVRGAAASFPFTAGMVAGNALWLLATIFGLSALALRFEVVFIAIKWLGVTYLLFMAWKLWNASTAFSLEQTGAQKAKKRGDIVAGLALTLGNPKAMVFFGAILPHAVDLSKLSMLHSLYIVAFGILIDMTVQIAYLFLAERVRNLVKSKKHLKAINHTAAGLMAGSAAVIIART